MRVGRRRSLCPPLVARGCAGNPENSNSLRGFPTLLFVAGGFLRHVGHYWRKREVDSSC